jgi:hypothetical protein
MRKLILAVAGLGMMASTGPALAGLTEAGELEAARANARAGGPVSARDAELLNRYGCLSGTRSEFCRQRHRRWEGEYRNRLSRD